MKIYEQIRPLIIWLGLVELAWLGYWLFAGENISSGYKSIVIGWIISMLIWLVFVIASSRKNLFLQYSYVFSNLLGFVFVILVAVVIFGSTDTGRSGLLHAAIASSDYQLILLHTLRLLALGTVIKYMQGQLPLHFLIFGSIPDFVLFRSSMTQLFPCRDILA